MKLTKQDNEMFKMFHNSASGDNLIDYLERLTNHVCDARHWSEGDTKESSVHASKVIEEYLISKIRLQNTKKETNPNQFT